MVIYVVHDFILFIHIEVVSLFFFNLVLNPSKSVPQTLWSCSVEAISEYCRIVWDIFSMERSILFLIGDYERSRVPRFLNTWDSQGMDKLMQHFSTVGPAQSGTQELTSSTQIKLGCPQNYLLQCKVQIMVQ